MRKPVTPSARMSLLVLSFVGLALGDAGCTAAVMAGRAATTTIGIAADVTAATVRGGGRVAAAAVGASGDVADESIKVAAKLSKSGMVVFFDPKTGATWQAPVKEGLKLLAAAETAKIGAALTVLRVIRSGSVVGAVGEVAKFLVKSGDVVELAHGL